MHDIKLIRKDPIEWETSVEQAKPYISFIIDALESRFNLDSSDGKTQALEIMRPIIQKAPFLEQDGYINKLSLKESLEKGTDMASKIIQKIGARLN